MDVLVASSVALLITPGMVGTLSLEMGEMVERFGFAGLVVMLIAWVLNRLSKQLDELNKSVAQHTVAVNELRDYIRERS